jgi:hypothetical protein
LIQVNVRDPQQHPFTKCPLGVIFDRGGGLWRPGHFRFAPQKLTSGPYKKLVAMGQRTKSLRSSPLRGGGSREAVAS